MSGFAGIVEGENAGLDTAPLSKMRKLIERHGGDGSHNHCGDGFALAHSLLAHSPESVREQQPFTLDGQTWAVGDVRLDARTELVASLKSAGMAAESEQPDINLVLQAYLAWGPSCVQRLLGDFAFAIWVGTERKLFCARDHFGIKPFYYSMNGSTFIFSNDLDTVRSHPMVSDELDDHAICDYFAFGYNLDETSTSYGDIRRLPPGYSMIIASGGPPKSQIYRDIRFDGNIHYSSLSEYSEHFLDIFSRAVNDRLRTDRATFELSGGMDSTSVAAVASLLQGGNKNFSGLGITTASPEDLAAEGEAYFAAMVARKCGFQHRIIEAGQEADFYAYVSTAQPYAWPFAATTKRFAATARVHSKVLLGGQMGDVLFHGSGSPVVDQFRESTLPAFALDRTMAVLQKRRFRALGIRTLLRSDQPLIKLPPIPNWLAQDVIKSSRAEDRWKELFYRRGRHPEDCRAELAHDELRMPFWSHLFESYYHDLLCGIDCRQPFMDLRLVEFMLSIPASLKQEKKLLRHAMSELLPVEILNRGKTNLAGDIVKDCLMKPATFDKVPKSLPNSSRWIVEKPYWEAFENYSRGKEANPFTILCPVSFEHWIYNRQMLI